MVFEQKAKIVELTSSGRARTIEPLRTGLYCKLSIGRIEGEDEQEGRARTIENIPPELYNAIYSELEDDDVLFNDVLQEIAGRLDAHDGE